MSRQSLFCALLLAATCAAAAASAAESGPQPGTGQPAGGPPKLHLARPADDFASPYASPAHQAGPNLGHTAIERRLAGDGLTGSVGYLCGIDLYEPDRWQRGAGPDSSAGHKGTFLGAKLGYAFK
ncbi:hypothetical protein ACO2Q3_26635 [Caulobacter sp. KR2-114]|uniref:hypothetical protein n=1 Tax=Caulobacter sp. KR2-114 TaxID=3400912 RepID=UPI003C063437